MQFFSQGYNCAQSVVAAWADRYHIDHDTALRISASFGGGIGRMRLTCGAASGLFMLAGLETGSTDPKDREGKTRNYQVVQQLAEEFRKEMGSITCGELLGLNNPSKTGHDNSSETTMQPGTLSPVPEPRTPEYYRKRPCKEIVGCASQIFARFLEQTKSTDNEP